VKFNPAGFMLTHPCSPTTSRYQSSGMSDLIFHVKFKKSSAMYGSEQFRAKQLMYSKKRYTYHADTACDSEPKWQVPERTSLIDRFVWLKN
jgi:hypothetical protein